MAEVKYLHVSYDFIDNGNGDLMMVMDKPDGDEMADDENAKLIYDGSLEAMLVRNSGQIVHLPIIVEPVREMLGEIDKILVTEMDGDDIDDVYEAQIEILNGKLPLPKSVYDNMFKDDSKSV